MAGESACTSAGDSNGWQREPPPKLGLAGLLDFSVELTLDGERLSEQEIATLLAGTDGLVLLRGQWVEVSRGRLERTMRQFQAAEELSRTEGLSFSDAMRMLAGSMASIGNDDHLRPPNGRTSPPGPGLLIP